MPYVMSRIDVPEVDDWRVAFEAAAGDGRVSWRRHRIYQSLEEPSELVIALEVDSYDDAVSLRATLPSSELFAGARFAGEPRIVAAHEGSRHEREVVARLAVFVSQKLQPDDRRRTSSLVQLVRAQPGFRAGYHLRQLETGRMVSLTIWDSAAALEAAGRAVAERPAADRRGIRPTDVGVWQVEVDFSS
jgi:heme-degrading monooxygenase HmoA